MDIISIFFNMKVCCVFSLESPNGGDSNKYTQYTIFKVNKRAMMALGRSPEYHWDQIISKSVHRFSRGSRLKLFSIYSPGSHFVQQSERFEQFL